MCCGCYSCGRWRIPDPSSPDAPTPPPPPLPSRHHLRLDSHARALWPSCCCCRCPRAALHCTARAVGNEPARAAPIAPRPRRACRRPRARSGRVKISASASRANQCRSPADHRQPPRSRRTRSAGAVAAVQLRAHAHARARALAVAPSLVPAGRPQRRGEQSGAPRPPTAAGRARVRAWLLLRRAVLAGQACACAGAGAGAGVGARAAVRCSRDRDRDWAERAEGRGQHRKAGSGRRRRGRAPLACLACQQRAGPVDCAGPACRRCCHAA